MMNMNVAYSVITEQDGEIRPQPCMNQGSDAAREGLRAANGAPG